MDRWITDTELSTRFPYYTRANADEVGPDPFSPLGWSLGWMQGCVPGVAGGYVAFGAVSEEEFDLDPPEVFGNWGGYFYNQLSLPRVVGCRMPGASPEAIDQAYFGDRPGVPAYVPHPDDDSTSHSERLAETMGWAMSTDGYPAQDDAAAMSRRVAAERPVLATLRDAELVARGRAMAPLIYEAWVPYCQVCLSCSLGPGAVQAICAAIGRPGDAVKLMAAVGDVESAEASFAMWDLSRIIARSPELMSAFDAGVTGVLDAIAGSSSADAAEFSAAWNALLAEFGHRGPNEWDMRSHSWSTKPSLALGMLERLRHQSDDRSPVAARSAAAAERQRISAEILAALDGDPESKATLEAGLASAALFYALRERGKSTCIRLIHEGKLAFLELGHRLVERGVVSDPQQVFMLLDSELDDFLADPAAFAPVIAQRDRDYQELFTLEPPFIIKREDGVPPISTWARRGGGTAAVTVTAGEIIQGGAGAPGVVTGVARVILDPSDAIELEPGEIMIAPTTDPSWTPLFLSAAGVVVDVGAVASHAAIASRELGVPCAVSVVDATRRIPDGATITVDGSTGTVTVLSVP